MVQEFCVLKCFTCSIFQVHFVKKSKNWSCKMCGHKQSILKVYGQGSSKDCRIHVQKLNLLAAGKMVDQSDVILNPNIEAVYETDDANDCLQLEYAEDDSTFEHSSIRKRSKWDAYEKEPVTTDKDLDVCNKKTRNKKPAIDDCFTSDPFKSCGTEDVHRLNKDGFDYKLQNDSELNTKSVNSGNKNKLTNFFLNVDSEELDEILNI